MGSGGREWEAAEVTIIKTLTSMDIQSKKSLNLWSKIGKSLHLDTRLICIGIKSCHSWAMWPSNTDFLSLSFPLLQRGHDDNLSHKVVVGIKGVNICKVPGA